MSRFFAAPSSDSDSESDSSNSHSSNSSSSDVESLHSAKDNSQQAKKSKWLINRNQDSESDDQTKFLKSAADKRFEEMRGIGKLVLNALKIRDWITISNEYDKLLRLVIKHTALISSQNSKFFIRLIIDLRVGVEKQGSDKTVIAKMNSSTSKAFNQMKQKIKKEFKVRDGEIEAFKASPIDELDSMDEAERDIIEVPKKKLKKKNISTDQGDGSEGAGDDAAFVEVGSKGKPLEYRADNLFEKLDLVNELRGRKSTDKQEQIAILEKLLLVAKSTYQRVSVLLALIAARFDHIPTLTGCITLTMWQSAKTEIKELYGLLKAHPHLKVGARQDEETEAFKDKQVTGGHAVLIRGNTASFADRLDDEFFKALQTLDHHSSEYVERLRHEVELYSILVDAQNNLIKSGGASKDVLDLIVMRRVEHLYFRGHDIVKSIETKTTISDLCQSLSRSRVERVRIRSLLCNVYHLSINNEYNDARDMIAMSHLQELIGKEDLSTQTLYNRAITQLGLCAFRSGVFKDSQIILQDIQSGGKTRELLAQGSSQKHNDRSIEHEGPDRDRYIPFHMHINLELVDCVYLISAMLIEVPNMAFNRFDRRKAIAKQFRRSIEHLDRQVFNGPPESNRDYIYSAAKAMLVGEWQKSIELINRIGVLRGIGLEIVEMIESAIRVESLRCYVLVYKNCYSTFSIALLSSMFSVDINTCASVLSKMIYNDLFNGYIHDGVVFVEQGGDERLGYLISTVAEKLGVLGVNDYNLDKFKLLFQNLIAIQKTN